MLTGITVLYCFLVLNFTCSHLTKDRLITVHFFVLCSVSVHEKAETLVIKITRSCFGETASPTIKVKATIFTSVPTEEHAVPLWTERGSLTAVLQTGELSLAPFPSGSAAINTARVGGGLDLVSVFSPLLREAEKLWHGGCRLSGALRPQLAAQRAPSVISYV